MFLFGCTGCFAKDATITDRGPDAHKNLLKQKRAGFGDHRSITLNWVGDKKKQEACNKCPLKKLSGHTL